MNEYYLITENEFCCHKKYFYQFYQILRYKIIIVDK